MPKILVLQLDKTEKPGFIRTYTKSRKLETTVLPVYKKPQFIPTDFFTHLIILPSPVDTTDYGDYPFLWYAKSVIRDFIVQKKPILGICMGSQLLAEVIGEKIQKAKKPEVGFYPLDIVKKSALIIGTHIEKTKVFEWHQMEVATHKYISQIAKSKDCKTQIFEYGKNVFGIQFHLEITKPLIRAYQHVFDAKGTHAEKLEIENQKHNLFPFYRVQEKILDNFLMHSGR